MEDRLNALSIAQARPDIDKSQPPRADVMVTLLSQGLQSQDRELLDVRFKPLLYSQSSYEIS